MKTCDSWVTVYVGQVAAESREDAWAMAREAFFEMMIDDDEPFEIDSVDVEEVESCAANEEPDRRAGDGDREAEGVA